VPGAPAAVGLSGLFRELAGSSRPLVVGSDGSLS
jgi:hypothetical protein